MHLRLIRILYANVNLIKKCQGINISFVSIDDNGGAFICGDNLENYHLVGIADQQTKPGAPCLIRRDDFNVQKWAFLR